jgi:hypothetical protein
MATFKYFNLKVLPHSGKKEHLIGEDGYKEIFQYLKEKINQSHRARNIIDISHKLRNDFYLSILHIHMKEDFTHGTILKFDKPQALFDTLSGHPMQSIPENASAHRHEFDYLFNYKRHVIAIQHIAGRSPNTNSTIAALISILTPIVRSIFPNHYLKVEILTSSEELNKILTNAEKFRKAEVNFTITNHDDYLADEVKSTEAEMRSNGIAEIHHSEVGPEKGFMSNLSSRCLAYLKIAKKNGNATIRYVDKNTKKIKSYIMRDNPLITRITKTIKTKEDLFLQDLNASIIKADQQSKA